MTLEERIKKLEEIERIKRLKYTYCYQIDKGNWDGVLELFSRESTADYGSFGRCRNKKEIEKFFRRTIPRTLQFLVHTVNNPIIDLDGDTASGVWYLSEQATSGRKALWIHGRYDDEYVQEGGDWKIKKTRLAFNYVTPFDQGWAKQKMYRGSGAK